MTTTINVQTALKKGLNLIVLNYTGVSLADLMEGHAKKGPDGTLISDKQVTPEMLAAINSDIQDLIRTTERKFRTKLPFTLEAEQGSSPDNFTVTQKVLN